MPRSLACCFLLGLLALTTGCGGGVRLAPVEGVVKKGGVPLKNVRVEFWPTGDGPKSAGLTDDTGRYTLKTEDGKTDGAVVGSHTVLVKDMDRYGDKFLGRKAENMPNLNPGAKERFSKAYADPAVTDLKRDVKAEPKNVIDLDVK